MELDKKYVNNDISSKYFTGEKKIVDFNKLSDEEKKILYAFSLIMSKVGISYGFEYRFENYAEMGGVCIFKDEDIWQTYAVERNEIFGALAFDNLYDACINVFNSLDLYSSKYCIEKFYKLIKGNFDMDEINIYFNQITKKFNLKNNKNIEYFKECNYDVDTFIQRHPESRNITKEEIKSLKVLCEIFKKIGLGEELILGIGRSSCSNCIFKTNDNKWIVWETDERRGFSEAKKLDNINDACIECIKMSIDFNTNSIIKEFNLGLNREITDLELLEFANNMNYTSNIDESLLRISTYSPGDSENIAKLLDKFVYNPNQKEKVLEKYKHLKDKYINNLEDGYSLVGTLNIFGDLNLNGFIYPIFKKDNQYYFENALDGQTIDSFEEITREDVIKMIKFLDLKDANITLKNIKLVYNVGDSPIVAYQNDEIIFISDTTSMIEYLDSLDIKNEILQHEIEVFKDDVRGQSKKLKYNMKVEE